LAPSTAWRILAGGYLLASYAALPLMPETWRRLDGFLSGRAVWAIYAAGAALFLAMLAAVARRGAGKPRRCALFVSLAGAAALLGLLEEGPAEKIHMVQYALFGLLVYRALKESTPPGTNSILLRGSGICLLAGAGDEVGQLFLANRVFTWHDVFVNTVSGVLMLAALRFCLSPADPGKNARHAPPPGTGRVPATGKTPL